LLQLVLKILAALLIQLLLPLPILLLLLVCLLLFTLKVLLTLFGLLLSLLLLLLLLLLLMLGEEGVGGGGVVWDVYLGVPGLVGWWWVHAIIGCWLKGRDRWLPGVGGRRVDMVAAAVPMGSRLGFPCPGGDHVLQGLAGRARRAASLPVYICVRAIALDAYLPCWERWRSQQAHVG
jgi:hypothetical protein